MRTRSSRHELATLLTRAREYVGQSSGSGWAGLSPVTIENDLTDAIVELKGTAPFRDEQLRTFFAPNGPLQQIAVMSGWGDRFSEFAARFDALIDRV